MHNVELLQKALDDFIREVQIITDVRFEAHSRLSRRQRESSYVVSLLSLYVIGLFLIPNMLTLNTFQTQLIFGSSTILAVFIIFTSLMDTSQNFHSQGEFLHQCARKLGTVSDKARIIDAKDDKAKEDLEQLQEEFRYALFECPVNHEKMDYRLEIYYKPDLFPRRDKGDWKLTYRFWHISLYLFLCYSWLIPHLLVVTLVSTIIYYFVLKPL